MFYGTHHYDAGLFYRRDNHDGDPHFHVWPLAGAGARYHFSGSNAILFRASWPVGVQVGITF
jgi:hypothetical protein